MFFAEIDPKWRQVLGLRLIWLAQTQGIQKIQNPESRIQNMAGGFFISWVGTPWPGWLANSENKKKTSFPFWILDFLAWLGIVGRGSIRLANLHGKRLRFIRLFGHFAYETLAIRKVFGPFCMRNACVS